MESYLPMREVGKVSLIPILILQSSHCPHSLGIPLFLDTWILILQPFRNATSFPVFSVSQDSFSHDHFTLQFLIFRRISTAPPTILPFFLLQPKPSVEFIHFSLISTERHFLYSRLYFRFREMHKIY